MISIKTNPLLLAAMTLSMGTINAMEQFYKMTIENQLDVKMFLNVPNPNTLTSKSPYPFVKGQRTKIFLLSKEETSNQTIAFPAHWPSNKVQLPIEKKETHFIIKNHPTDRNKTILEDDSKKIIIELITLHTSD